MRYLFNISVYTALFILGFVLQGLNIFQIELVTPNILIILIASLLVFYKRNDFFIIFTPAMLGVCLWSLLFSPFWLESILIVIILSALLAFLDTQITGTKIIDICIFVVALTVDFYIVAWLFGIQSFGWFVLGETIYNLLLTPLFYFMIKRIQIITR